MIIKPKKPILFPNFESAIMLRKSEVDTGDIKVRAIKEGYLEQKQRHITVIGGTSSRIMVEKLDLLFQKDKEDKIRQIKKLFKKIDWQFEPKNIYHILKLGMEYDDFEKDERESYIRLIKQPGMTKFYRKLNRLLGTNLPTQFPHITLFTNGERPDASYRGIAINSKEKFKQLHPKKIK